MFPLLGFLSLVLTRIAVSLQSWYRKSGLVLCGGMELHLPVELHELCGALTDVRSRRAARTVLNLTFGKTYQY